MEFFILFFVGIFLFIWYDSNQEEQALKRIEEAKKNAPCKHGTVGAKLNPKVCRFCTNEIYIEEQRRIAEEKARAEKDAKREKARLQRIKDIERVNREKELESERINNVKNSFTPEKLIEIVDIHFLRIISPEDFEVLTMKMFEAKGFRAERTSLVGDFGVDGFLWLQNNLILVQCKRNNAKNNVGRPVLQQLYGNIHDFRSKNPDKTVSGLLVTSSSITKEAGDWIGDKPIQIINHKGLIELLKSVLLLNLKSFNDYIVDLVDKYKASEELIRKNISSSIPGSLCPKCSDLTKSSRRNGYHKTWCINPNCNYKTSFYYGSRKRYYRRY